MLILRAFENLAVLAVLATAALLGLALSETIGYALILLFPIAVVVFFFAMFAYSVAIVVIALLGIWERRLKQRIMLVMIGTVSAAGFGWAAGSLIFGEDVVSNSIKAVLGWLKF